MRHLRLHWKFLWILLQKIFGSPNLIIIQETSQILESINSMLNPI